MSSAVANDVQVDYSELRGRHFTCLGKCGLCCLCQPELLPQEEAFFRRNFPNRLVRKQIPHKHTALALRNGSGSCQFLSGRRCTIYQDRPHYCRAFPLHIHVGNRVQVELDLSCRGVWDDKGEDALDIGRGMVSENRAAIERTLQEAGRVYDQFFHNCQDSGIFYSSELLREDLSKKMDKMSDLSYLATVLDSSAEDELMALPSSARAVNMKDLEMAARETSLESLSARTLLESPVYCDEEGDWNVFSLKNGSLRWDILNEEGVMGIVRSIDPSEVKLLEPSGKGRDLFIDYLKLLNNRDSMLGYAFFLVDQFGYEDPLPNVYFGAIATAALDLLWRSSLLAHTRGQKALDESGVREGIIFYDMDRLDAPTIGAFI